MIYENIKNFYRQFYYEPEIKNNEFTKRKRFKNFVIVGMGGSALAARLLSLWENNDSLSVHNDYGLPELNKKSRNSLIILSSHSGNTEEVLEGFRVAKKNKLSMAIITTGGKLLSLAKKNKIPYIELPDKKIQSRMAIGYNFLALIKLLRKEKVLKEVIELRNFLNPQNFRLAGSSLAREIKNYIPIIYSSSKNAPLGYIWKIKFNETAKTPAFANVFPELTHNELAGFHSSFGKKELKKFYFIFLVDPADFPRIKKRMKIAKEILEKDGMKVKEIKLEGKSIAQKVFSSIVLVDWITFYLAQAKKVNPEEVLVIERFKKLMKRRR